MVKEPENASILSGCLYLLCLWGLCAGLSWVLIKTVEYGERIRVLEAAVSVERGER